jgi:XTP/dITP diphosphohydrolase
LRKVIVATKNAGKVQDFQHLLSKKGFEVVSLLDIPNIPDIEETGETFIENATLKAEAISSALNEIVIADDSGLSIDVLGGKPGVFSARYAGVQKSDNDNIHKVLHELEGVPFEERSARFHCALAFSIPGQPTIIVEGTCDGIITNEPAGNNGFGYDPIFFVKDKNKTMAQLSKEEKNEISHRANALEKLRKKIIDLL